MDLTDEDKQMYGQIDAAIKERIMPNAHHRLCCWHKVDRGYITKVKSMKKHYIDVVFVDTCRKWFYSFTLYIDSERKEAAHIKFFEMWLNEKKKIVSRGLFVFTFNYWHRSFKHNLYRLCFRHYKYVPGGDNRSSSFTESGNSMLKRDPTGPKPLMGIDRSHTAIVDHEQ